MESYDKLGARGRQNMQCSSRVDKGYLAFLEQTFRDACLKTAHKTVTISPQGGSIDLYGQEIIFPAGAVLVDTDVEISVDNNPEHYPKSLWPITLIIDCKPSEFKKPVKVKLATWFRPGDDRDCRVVVLSKSSSETEWQAIREATFTRRGSIQYEVLQFSKQTAGVTELEASVGSVHFFNDVWMRYKDGRVAAFLCKDMKSLEEWRRHLYDSHRNVISLPPEVDVPMNGTMKMELSCAAPAEVEMIPEPSRPITITQAGVRDTNIYCNFNPEPPLSELNFTGRYKVRYGFEVRDPQQIKDEESCRSRIPLSYSWSPTVSRSQDNEYY